MKLKIVNHLNFLFFFRPPKHSREDLLKFIFIDGFITPEIDPGLAVGVSGANLEAISGVVEVFLCKRTIDDPCMNPLRDLSIFYSKNTPKTNNSTSSQVSNRRKKTWIFGSNLT